MEGEARERDGDIWHEGCQLRLRDFCVNIEPTRSIQRLFSTFHYQGAYYEQEVFNNNHASCYYYLNFLIH